MKVTKLFPQGYCFGVEKAISLAKEAVKNSDQVYILGALIHNQLVNKELEEAGAILVDGDKPRIELLAEIPTGTVIFSAHGVGQNVWLKAKEKGLKIVDATCPNVKIVHKNMERHFNQGYDCYYIGTPKHPECEAILSISDKITLIVNSDDIKKIKPSSLIYITNQTTLSKWDTLEIYEEIKANYPQAVIDDKICLATTKRQEAVYYQEKVDLCIVVGDKRSSNTKKLYEVAIKANLKALAVADINELKSYNFEGIKSVSVTSGASTPAEIVDEIIAYLKELN